MFNKVILEGNLTRDIEMKYSNSNSALAKSAIAITRKYKLNGEKKEETCFVDITFFGRTAEIANQYLKKGSKILIEGRLHFEQWIDQQSGQKRSKHSVSVETMQMLSSRSQENQYDNYDDYQAPIDDDYRGDKNTNQEENQSSSGSFASVPPANGYNKIPNANQ